MEIMELNFESLGGLWLQLICISLCFFIYIAIYFDLKRIIRNIILFQKLPDRLNALPFFGIAHQLAFLKDDDIIDYLAKHFKLGNETKLWLFGIRAFVTKDVEDIEAILGSIKHITKGAEYDLVMDWLNEGLLTSRGEKWHVRRKMLTPAFHFKILEDCLPVFNNNAKILTEKLLETEGKPFDYDSSIALCTLDIICEAAMGIKLNAQHNEAPEYVSDIKRMFAFFGMRVMKFWYRSKLIFSLSPAGWESRKVLARLHNFTEKVIAERKQEYIAALNKPKNEHSNGKNKAFLDCLIDMELKNPGTFTKLDMREEVDTFMLEGHDTTNAAISFTIFMLGKHKDVQEKVDNELNEIFEGSDRNVTFNDLRRMRYLEMVIKETLRLYPSVPVISRVITEEFTLKGKNTAGMIMPEGTNIVFFPFLIHRNPELFPDPYKFDPERFSEEQSSTRHPFSYFPFSAGPRNCIGQKFAMMELKVVLSTILRSCVIETVTKEEDLKYVPFVVLKTNKPIIAKFTPRIAVKQAN